MGTFRAYAGTSSCADRVYEEELPQRGITPTGESGPRALQGSSAESTVELDALEASGRQEGSPVRRCSAHRDSKEWRAPFSSCGQSPEDRGLVQLREAEPVMEKPGGIRDPSSRLGVRG